VSVSVSMSVAQVAVDAGGAHQARLHPSVLRGSRAGHPQTQNHSKSREIMRNTQIDVQTDMPLNAKPNMPYVHICPQARNHAKSQSSTQVLNHRPQSFSYVSYKHHCFFCFFVFCGIHIWPTNSAGIRMHISDAPKP
jgi:hypothetical protein